MPGDIPAYPAFLGCPLKNGYGLSRAASFTRTSVLKGRPRSELKDLYPPFNVNLGFDFSDTNFSGWQDFWTRTEKGKLWFTMDLFLDGSEKPCMVHALSPWTASISPNMRWAVSLNAEAYLNE